MSSGSIPRSTRSSTIPSNANPIASTASFLYFHAPDKSSIFISSRGIPAYFSINVSTSFLFHFPLKHSTTARSHSCLLNFLYLFLCAILFYFMCEAAFGCGLTLKQIRPCYYLPHAQPAAACSPFGDSGFTDFRSRVDIQTHFSRFLSAFINT